MVMVAVISQCSYPIGTMPSSNNTDNGNSTVYNNSTKAPSSQGFLPWYVQFFQGENLTYIFIGLSVLVTSIIVLYICCAVVCCVICRRKRLQRTNPAEKDYAALEFLPGDGAAVVLTGYHKKDDCSASIDADASDSSIDLPDTSSDVHSASLNLHILPAVSRPTSTEREEGLGMDEELPTTTTAADERECLPMAQCHNETPQSQPSCQLKKKSASMPMKQRVQGPQALHEPKRDRLLAVHPPPRTGRTASGNQIIVPIAADGYAYLNAVHTTAEGYSYIHIMNGLEHMPPRSGRPHSYGGQLSSKSPDYANHEIIAQQTGAVEYGEKEYAEIVIPEDPTKADPILSPK